MTDSVPLKRCIDCEKEFPSTTDYFYASTVNKGGLMPRCIPCRSDYMSVRYAHLHPKPEKPTPPEGQKFCIKCGIPKPVDIKHFRDKANARDGFYNVCRVCMNEQDTQRTHKRHEDTPPAFDETLLKKCSTCPNSFPATPHYFDRNKRKRDGLSPECKQCNKQRNKEYSLHYADEIQVRRFIYKTVNRERSREKGRAYARAKRAEHNASVRARYDKVKQNGGTYTARDVQAQYNEQQGKCYWCQKELEEYHVDHVIPVIRGGSNGPENIVIACPYCNQSKGSKTVEAWLRYLEKFILSDM